MGTTTQTKEVISASRSGDESLADGALLTRIFEGFEDDGVEVDDAAESCVPFIMDGLRDGVFAADLQNPLHKTICRVLDQAGIELPSPPSMFE